MPRPTTKQRRRKMDRCGPKCFGDPSSRKAKKAGRPRYPLCTEGCEVNCKEAHAKWSRARKQHEPRVAARIRRKAARRGCRWAKVKKP